MSKNTVKKYVAGLETKRLITTEPTTVRTKNGKRNGNLRYNILPIQAAVNYFHERQMAQLELDAEHQRAEQKLRRFAPQEPLCAALLEPAGTNPGQATQAV